MTIIIICIQLQANCLLYLDIELKVKQTWRAMNKEKTNRIVGALPNRPKKRESHPNRQMRFSAFVLFPRLFVFSVRLAFSFWLGGPGSCFHVLHVIAVLCTASNKVSFEWKSIDTIVFNFQTNVKSKLSTFKKSEWRKAFEIGYPCDFITP